MLKRFLNLWRAIRFFRYFVIADSNDNSITLSRKLYKHIELSSHSGSPCSLFVFRIPQWGTYGFSLAPVFDRKTQVAELQYNSKYRSIGFESLCPTVNRIFMDYGIPFGTKSKLTVTVRKTHGIVFYNIERPVL